MKTHKQFQFKPVRNQAYRRAFQSLDDAFDRFGENSNDQKTEMLGWRIFGEDWENDEFRKHNTTGVIAP